MQFLYNLLCSEFCYAFTLTRREYRELIYYRLRYPTRQGDENLAQAGTECISSQHGTPQVTSGSLVILNRNHAVNVGEVGHLCGRHNSIVDLLVGWNSFKKISVIFCSGPKVVCII